MTNNLCFSDDVGVKFFGSSEDRRYVLFFVKTLPEELTELKLVIDGPFDADEAQLAEDTYEYKIDVTK